MTYRERLMALMDEKRLIELYFSPGSTYYLVRLLAVGEDFVEFETFDENRDIATAHNIMPLSLLTGVTVNSIECERERLEAILRHDETP